MAREDVESDLRGKARHLPLGPLDSASLGQLCADRLLRVEHGNAEPLGESGQWSATRHPRRRSQWRRTFPPGLLGGAAEMDAPPVPDRRRRRRASVRRGDRAGRSGVLRFVPVRAALPCPAASQSSTRRTAGRRGSVSGDFAGGGGDTDTSARSRLGPSPSSSTRRSGTAAARSAVPPPGPATKYHTP